MSSTNLTTVTLPSKGLLYSDIKPEFTLRSMGVSEEKMIFGSNNANSVQRALRACIVEPKNVNFSELLSADEHFLLLKLRIHTFGPDYHIVGKCSECGKKSEYDINLDDLIVHELDDNFTEPIEMKLPDSGDKIQVRLLRNEDIDAVEKQAKRLSRSIKVNQGEIEYVLRMARMIKVINKEEQDPVSAQSYVESMTSRDSAYFWSILDDIRIGYESRLTVTCPECGEEFEVFVPINSEFFRPKFRNK